MLTHTYTYIYFYVANCRNQLWDNANSYPLQVLQTIIKRSRRSTGYGEKQEEKKDDRKSLVKGAADGGRERQNET